MDEDMQLQDTDELKSSLLNYSPFANITNPQIYCVNANSYSFSNKVKEMTSEQIKTYKSLRIKICGTQIKAQNAMCGMITLVAASFLIFPLFFTQCQWWKRKVYRNFRVENSAYESLVELIRNTNAMEVYLMVEDNYFNRNKAEIIIEALQRSNIRNFVFYNSATGVDCQGQNFTNFVEYMKPIKKLRLNSDLSWRRTSVVLQ